VISFCQPAQILNKKPDENPSPGMYIISVLENALLVSDQICYVANLKLAVGKAQLAIFCKRFLPNTLCYALFFK
jgi:hypothetical protein